MRRAVVAVAVAVLAVACGPTEAPSPTGGPSTSTSTTAIAKPASTTSTTASTTTTPFVEEEVGPFAGLRWPGGRVPAGALLHDDGTTLWSITLDGERTAVWNHPKVAPLEVAAGPGGVRVAMSVLLPSETTDDLSSVLYVLEQDGTIRTIDAADDFVTLVSPMFVRPPTEPDTPPRLYWLRLGEMVSTKTGRLDTRVMVETDQRPAKVVVPLRYHEAVFAMQSYPGAVQFTISLFRQNDVPTRLEIVENKDFNRLATDASLLMWTDNEFRANSDIFDGVAWLTPELYVVPVAHEFYMGDYSLRLFKDRCEYIGSHVVYQGTDIGRGYAEYPWPLLPGGPDQVLVITADDEQALFAGEPDVPWTAINIHTGSFTTIGARYEPGPWTWVEPADTTNPSTTEPDCSDWTWTYP